MSLLTAHQLNVSLNATPILKDLAFEIPAGILVGILGPNGSGKTTLLRTVSGILPYRGVLRFFDHPVRNWSRRAMARKLAFVRQTTSFAFDFSVLELVLLGRSPHKGWLENYGADDHRLVQRAIEQVEMDGFEHRSVRALSGGELQRVLLAQALVQEAEVLLLDEPTAHLDVHHQFGFLDRVRQLVDEGRSVIAVFHDLMLAARYSDTLLILDRGRIAGFGPPQDILTTDLIADVFRMHARLRFEEQGRMRIEFLEPIEVRQPEHSASS